MLEWVIDNIRHIADAGANTLVVGNAIFGSPLKGRGGRHARGTGALSLPCLGGTAQALRAAPQRHVMPITPMASRAQVSGSGTVDAITVRLKPVGLSDVSNA